MRTASYLLAAAFYYFAGPAHGGATEIPRFTIQDASLSNGEKTLKRSIFIGHYGETFSYSGDWNLHDPQLNAGIEIVRFSHSSASGLTTETVPESAFERPEEFASKRLEQLLVIPQASRNYQDLTALRTAKEKDLIEKGFRFEISGPPMPTAYWPAGTFEVRITSPYRLTQVYTETEGRLFILTGASRTASEDPFAEALGRMYFNQQPRKHSSQRDSMATGGFLNRSIPLVAFGFILLAIPWWKHVIRPVANASLGAGIMSMALGWTAFQLSTALTAAGRESLVSPGPLGWSLYAALLCISIVQAWRIPGPRRWVTLLATTAGTAFVFALIMGITDEIPKRIYTVPQEFQTLTWMMGMVYGACLGLSLKVASEDR